MLDDGCSVEISVVAAGGEDEAAAAAAWDLEIYTAFGEMASGRVLMMMLMAMRGLAWTQGRLAEFRNWM